jgi:uncharacterized protein (TIGR03435 family)
MTFRPWQPAAGIAALAAACALYSPAQTPAPADSPHFEVASLKPSLPNAQGGGIIRPMPGNQGYVATNMPLRTYLMIAYTVRDTQISGAPGWFGTDLYDMNAKAEKSSTVEELHIMLQNLLAERCQLKLHKESKEVSGYAMVIDKAPKFTEHDADDRDHPPIRPTGPGALQGTNANMELLALFISRGLDRPVVDKTGLTKYYDFKLEIPLDRGDTNPDGTPRPPSPPDMSTISAAMKEQLGLRLEPTKATSTQLIIDHIEKPSGN